jgi:hypothetical protein
MAKPLRYKPTRRTISAGGLDLGIAGVIRAKVGKKMF